MGAKEQELLKIEITDFSGGMAYPANMGEAEILYNLTFYRDKRLVQRPGLVPASTATTGGGFNRGFYYSAQFNKFFMVCADGIYKCLGTGDTPSRIFAATIPATERVSFADYGAYVYATSSTMGLVRINSTPTATAVSTGVSNFASLFVRQQYMYGLVGKTVYYSGQDAVETYSSASTFSFDANVLNVFMIYNDLYFVLDNGRFEKLIGVVEDDFYRMPWGYYEGKWIRDSMATTRSRITYATTVGLWLFDGIENKLLTTKFDIPGRCYGGTT